MPYLQRKSVSWTHERDCTLPLSTRCSLTLCKRRRECLAATRSYSLTSARNEPWYQWENRIVGKPFLAFLPVTDFQTAPHLYAIEYITGAQFATKEMKAIGHDFTLGFHCVYQLSSFLHLPSLLHSLYIAHYFHMVFSCLLHFAMNSCNPMANFMKGMRHRPRRHSRFLRLKR